MVDYYQLKLIEIEKNIKNLLYKEVWSLQDKFKHSEIERLIEKGKEIGNLSYNEIFETLSSIEDLSLDEIDDMYESLIENGVIFGDEKEIEIEEERRKRR